MLFQMMFAIITPALISGAVAERIKFRAYVLFTVLWVTVVYFPLCHMVWGKGGYFNWALGGKIPVLDFAGGTVVHISSGVSALVCALVLGRRSGYPQRTDAAAQRRVEPHRRGLALGRLVRVQRRQRGERRDAGDERVCRDAFFRRRRRVELGGDRMAAQGQTQRAGRGVRHGRGTGHHHARVGIRLACRRRSASAWRRASSVILP